jgi:hypothetical protein
MFNCFEGGIRFFLSVRVTSPSNKIIFGVLPSSHLLVSEITGSPKTPEETVGVISREKTSPCLHIPLSMLTISSIRRFWSKWRLPHILVFSVGILDIGIFRLCSYNCLSNQRHSHDRYIHIFSAACLNKRTVNMTIH